MKKQILATFLSIAFASTIMLPTVSASNVLEQSTTKVDYAVAVENGNSNFPVQVNNPVNIPAPKQTDKPTIQKPVKKHKPAKIHKQKQKKPRPEMRSSQNNKNRGIAFPKGTQNRKPTPDWKKPKPDLKTPKPGNTKPSTTQTGRTKVHGPHWCYGACSLHDAGLHNAPRTQKHWCDGYK